MKSIWIAGLAAVGLVAVLGAVLPIQAQTDQQPVSRLAWQNEEVVALGRAIYEAECASCHGADLEGAPDWRVRDDAGFLPAPPHDETGHTWHHPDEVLIALTTYGTAALVGGDYQSNMMGFGDRLSEDEIIAVLSYIKSTWPDEVIEIHNQINADAGG